MMLYRQVRPELQVVTNDNVRRVVPRHGDHQTHLAQATRFIHENYVWLETSVNQMVACGHRGCHDDA
jgi:hypothetical protein